jgi:type IV pilus assembly protein PilE
MTNDQTNLRMHRLNKPLSPQNNQRHAKGFSLIELLLVLSCLALLTGLALPTYDRWQLRSQRAQARLALTQLAQWLERSAAANGRYPAWQDVPVNVWQIQGLRYRLSATLTDQSFALQATPLAAQATDACGTLSLDHTGQTGATGVTAMSHATLSATDCWQR